MAREIGKFEGGPWHGEKRYIEQTLVRIHPEDRHNNGSYVLTGVDTKYEHLRYYKWELYKGL